nr:reverse transcriptase domain, reverse transcriptase zinc-binding domain protein [Tanacetum cinerariifolium]
MLFKVDFEKAFYSISWKYLDYMLHKLGFGSRWRTWINNCLMSARTSILINGSPTSEFSLKRGLRQGDHLSPFLFIIVIEGLHLALNDGIASNMVHGVRIGSNIYISHIFYADDVIILSDWNQNDMENITRILNIFYIAFGLKINFHKSNVFGVGVSNSEVVSMAACCEADIDLGGCQTSGTWDTWLGNDPLYIRYNRLFHLKNTKDCFISQRILNGSWEWDWCRPITIGRSKIEFDNLIIDISNMEIDDLVESDTCVWSLSNDDSFLVNSVRKHIDEHSLPFLFPCTRWYKMIPKKNLVRSWIDLPLPSFLSCEDWTNWFDSWHVSKDKKSREAVGCNSVGVPESSPSATAACVNIE